MLFYHHYEKITPLLNDVLYMKRLYNGCVDKNESSIRVAWDLTRQVYEYLDSIIILNEHLVHRYREGEPYITVNRFLKYHSKIRDFIIGHNWSYMTMFKDESYHASFDSVVIVANLSKYWELYNQALRILETHPPNNVYYHELVSSRDTVIPPYCRDVTIPLKRSFSL